MEISFILSLDDYVAFQSFYAKHSHEGGLRRWLVVGFLLIVLACFTVPQLAKGHWSDTLPVVLMALVFAIVIIAFRSRLNAWRLRMSLSKTDKARLLCEQRLTLSKDALIHASEFHSGSHPWHAIQGIEATDRHAFLFTGKNIAYVVHCRAFASKEDFEIFVQTAKSLRRAAVEGRDADSDLSGTLGSVGWQAKAAETFRPSEGQEKVRVDDVKRSQEGTTDLP
jgi:hypothetical protein